MPEWKTTLTRTVLINGELKALQAENVAEFPSRNMAILNGIDKLLHQANELVPKEALDYWREQRSGSMQPYEVQSELENRWGITFGIEQITDSAVPIQPVPRAQPRNGATPEPEISDLDTMLKNQLQALQTRNATLNASIEKMTAERDKNDANIMRIAQFLGPQPTLNVLKEAKDEFDNALLEHAQKAAAVLTAATKKRRGRPPKVQPHAE